MGPSGNYEMLKPSDFEKLWNGYFLSQGWDDLDRDFEVTDDMAYDAQIQFAPLHGE